MLFFIEMEYLDAVQNVHKQVSAHNNSKFVGTGVGAHCVCVCVYWRPDSGLVGAHCVLCVYRRPNSGLVGAHCVLCVYVWVCVCFCGYVHTCVHACVRASEWVMLMRYLKRIIYF